MELSSVLTVLSIFGMLFAGSAVIIKRNNKRISNIASGEIKKSQLDCRLFRGEQMAEIRKRIKLLEENDISKQLTIVKIEATLENLTQGHEKTQTMILDMGGQFHEITSELIKTIQSIK